MEQRYQAVLAVIRDGVPIVEVARRFDVSRQAVHRWLRWYGDEGVQGLKDRSHAPPRCAHQTPAEVEVWLVEARRLIRCGGRGVWCMNRRGLGWSRCHLSLRCIGC